MSRHDIMESMFANPTIVDELDFFFKDDTARRLLFYHQVKITENSCIFIKFKKSEETTVEEDDTNSPERYRNDKNIAVMQKKKKTPKQGKKLILPDNI